MLEVIALLALTATPPLEDDRGNGRSQACWIYVTGTDVDEVDMPAPHLCQGFLGSGASRAQARSIAFVASGFGVALDAGPGCEAEVRTANATGVFGEEFFNECGGGFASILAEVEANGVADLLDSDCAAAALGFAEVVSSLTGPVRAVLTQSMGETSQGQLGGVSGSYGGWGAHMPVLQPGAGKGTYTDSDSNFGSSSGCVDFFEYKVRSKAYIKVWANATLLQASCTADMDARAGIWFTLDNCPM